MVLNPAGVCSCGVQRLTGSHFKEGSILVRKSVGNAERKRRGASLTQVLFFARGWREGAFRVPDPIFVSFSAPPLFTALNAGGGSLTPIPEPARFMSFVSRRPGQ